MIDTAIFNDIHKFPPVDTTYVAGRWHHGRVALGGFVVEAKTYAKSLFTPYNRNRRFLIIGRARSGTTLLTRLLNEHPDIHCDGEILHRNVLLPRTFFNRMAGNSAAPVYGAKFLSYQMVQVHRIRDPRAFLGRLADQGVSLIHLKRDTFHQTLSLLVAQRRNQYHSDEGASKPKQKFHVAVRDFVARMTWSEALLDYERTALQGLGATHIDYDSDLSDATQQQATAASLFQSLGVKNVPVKAALQKVLSKDPRDTIENFDEVCRALANEGMGHLLPKEAQYAR
ncbi:sulfotransferase [Celeribacter sp.]|uniref:sulfotransferase n=1 Tax=Celeribacter sp. TaxID=1890673 RepID=UPI003A94E0E1